LLNPTIKKEHVFKSGVTASIDPSKCIHCLKCVECCRFGAIDDHLVVNSIDCEGCGFCYHGCPVKAVFLKENLSGHYFISETKYGPFVHAKLGVAEENSGKLVSLVRKQAQDLALKQGKALILIDGAPGIGCPVIACISNVDCAVVVTEPTLSGLHDAKRVIEVAKHFSVPVKLIINKFNLNTDMTHIIEKYCSDHDIPMIGKIEFDKAIVDAVVNGKTIMETSHYKLQETIKQIWKRVIT